MSCGGALTHFPSKLGLKKIFSHRPGGGAGAPTAPPGYAYGRRTCPKTWCWGELAELTVDDTWQLADAGDQELRRMARNSRRSTMELGGEDKGYSNF